MQQSFEILEFDRLRKILEGYARTSPGAELAAEITPSQAASELIRHLSETSEAVRFLSESNALDIHDFPDPRPALQKLSIEDVNLDPFEVLNLLRLISVAAGLHDTFRDQSSSYPLLTEITSAVQNLRSLFQRIRASILPSGEIDDFASPELREVRARMTRVRSQIQRSLESVLKRADEAHALQEDYITIRNDRYVLPIRNDNRGAIVGVVHGMSSSGQTAFVEPLETIEFNNEIVRLRETEQTEITKVLFRLTEDLRENRAALEEMARVVALLDFIAARARLAIAQSAIEPTINEEGRLVLQDARHPLLESNLRSQGLEIVPVSLELDADHRVMVISGPNAGGKTVVLKTVGLLSLMAHAGLHVPAKRADIPVFVHVFADIGDHQSIAANLSTFTAHIENVRDIDIELEVPALVLLDEVGTGTDPEEGAALGVAIVDHFKRRGAHVVVSTHYSPLKVYATSTAGVLNASVEFDEKTLKPTYHLLTGVAGASSGIEIARRFGLPVSVTENARNGVSEAGVRALDYLRRLKEQFDEKQQTLIALEEERAAVATKYSRLELEFEKREQQREKEFRARLQSTVDDFSARAEKFLAAITDAAEARRARKDVERRAIELKAAAGTSARGLREASSTRAPEERLEEQPSTSAGIQPGIELRPGDLVEILSLGQEGQVETVGDDEIEVRVGSLRFREDRNNLKLIQSSAASKDAGRGRKIDVPRGVSLNLNEREELGTGEINVIGQNTREATDSVDKFLDEAFLNGYDRVRIVHGVGTGALKRAMQELLSGHPHVEKFLAAEGREGGSGATIVELKK